MEEEFNVAIINLDGSKLIEASAGTGKTYSVALLVLRLILEKKLPIEKILMVTFTIPAVAELESRIRKFVKLAWKYSSGEVISEEKITEIVGDRSAEKTELLKKARQSLDNLSVMTIHSFCNEFIINYPFEARHSFETDLMTDLKPIIEYVANDYWRKKINTINHIEVFRHLIKHITPESISTVVANALDDKEYVFTEINREAETLHMKDLILACDEAYRDYSDHYTLNWDIIKNQGAGHHHATNLITKSKIPEVFEEEFLKKCKGKDGAPGYFNQFFPAELEKAQLFINAENELANLTELYVGYIYSEIIDELRRKVLETKKRKNAVSYDDLITVMHKAVSEGTINDVVLKKYSAVFIDEFQDTDKKQYEIFSSIFEADKTVFYIGDPKQSIYGWRKADINTYKLASDEVGPPKRMNENFRSTQSLIDAINSLFAINDPFTDPDIVYKPVGKGTLELGSMSESGAEIVPVSINSFPKNSEIVNFVRNEILRLLMTEDILINGNRIQPSDIAVLARNKYQAADVKKALSDVNIPSVTIDESSVLASSEAKTIIVLLNVVLKPDRGGISKVLLNENLGFRFSDIETLNADFHLDIFRELKSYWLTGGIYNMLFRFLDVYNVRRHCLEKGIAGQRSLSNYYQLAEILHQVSSKTKCTPEELIVWLQREKKSVSEVYEQRIESEDNAVQIMTIHKSKGLTFKVVFAPFLDLTVKDDPDVFTFRTPDGYKFTPSPDSEQLEIYNTQTEQENRRLIYVAITRAQYKLYICESRHYPESSLKPFIAAEGPGIEKNIVRENNHIRYHRPGEVRVFAPRETPEIEIKNTFGIHSYSALSKGPHSAPLEKVITENTEGYDQFIFRELARGANAGTALHSIFERLEFRKPDTWLQTIMDASKYYPNIIKEKNEEKNIDGNIDLIHQMVNNVMNAEINIGETQFRLCEIDDERKLPELNFLFSVDKVNRQVVNEFLGEDAKLGGDTEIEGLMTGFMDLMFEHKGKYYILDWKSNHLGNNVNDYNTYGMEVAMTSNNYHLQYMIYTVALKRWLEKKIDKFDFESHYGGIIYVFLRGAREGQNTGIYTNRPKKELIEKLDSALRYIS